MWNQPRGILEVSKRAVNALKEIKDKRKLIFGAVEPLDGIESEADRLIGMLTLVKEDGRFHRSSIGLEADFIMKRSGIIHFEMCMMASINHGMPEPMVLKPEDKPYRHLQTIHGCLTDARIRLAKLVCTVRVGIVGNPRDGYFVKRRVLTVVNDKVRRVAGDNLGLYDRLKDKVEGQTGTFVSVIPAPVIYSTRHMEGHPSGQN